MEKLLRPTHLSLTNGDYLYLLKSQSSTGLFGRVHLLVPTIYQTLLDLGANKIDILAHGLDSS